MVSGDQGLKLGEFQTVTTQTHIRLDIWNLSTVFIRRLEIHSHKKIPFKSLNDLTTRWKSEVYIFWQIHLVMRRLMDPSELNFSTLHKVI